MFNNKQKNIPYLKYYWTKTFSNSVQHWLGMDMKHLRDSNLCLTLLKSEKENANAIFLGYVFYSEF